MKKRTRKKAIENRKAHFQYESLDDLEVGLVLTGAEVKSLRAGQMQLAGSYGRILQGSGVPELWLVGASIPGSEEKQRSIKLLAHRQEIDRLLGLIGQKGYTLVPKKVYFKGNRAKLLLSIAKGRQIHEKRAKLRERDVTRDIARTLREKVR